MIELDHVAVVASTLEAGRDYVRRCLNVDVPFGGEHPHMGTHNCLAKLGTDEFLEIIAINPHAPDPGRPRWFNLDHHGQKKPYLAHWIARTDTLDQTLSNLNARVGEPQECQRGALTWKLTVPEDGSFAYDGAFPSIIEWPMRPYPGASMADIGCQLVSLTLTHPDATSLRAELATGLSDSRIKIEQGDKVSIRAGIQTPDGIKYLS